MRPWSAWVSDTRSLSGPWKSPLPILNASISSLLMGMSPSPAFRKQPTHGHRGGGVGVGARRAWEEWGMGGEESSRRE